MGERRESVMDWLVLGFTMRMRMGCFPAMVVDGRGIGWCSSAGEKRGDLRFVAKYSLQCACTSTIDH